MYLFIFPRVQVTTLNKTAIVIMTTFEEDILGPDYSIDLNQFIPNDYLKLRQLVGASEACAALNLEFPSVEKVSGSSDSEDSEEQDETSEHSNENEQDKMDLDEKEEIGEAPKKDLLPARMAQPLTNGFPIGLEIYFAIYIWTLIYFEEYQEAMFVSERYKDTTLFVASPVVRAATRSASKFSTKSTNDTLEYAAIYRLPSLFDWEDESKGGSPGLAQLVKDALNKFQERVYTQLRGKFTKIKVSTVSKCLPLCEEHETIKAEDVLRVLNGVDPGWIKDPENEELLVPPQVAKPDDVEKVDEVLRRKWLNELVTVASELEQKSLVE